MDIDYTENTHPSDHKNQLGNNDYCKSSSFKPKTEDEIANEEKRRRKEKIIAALGDGISSLGNLFFTTKGAPNIYDNEVFGKEKSKLLLSSSIKEKFDQADKEYSNKLLTWQKEQEKLNKQQEKEDAINKKYSIRDGFGIKEIHWSDADFVNDCYDLILRENKDNELINKINKIQFSYEPIFTWDGRYWSHIDGHDKKIDNFKGKQGNYLKRDLIESILGDDDWTTSDNRNDLIKQIIELDNNWIKIK